MGVGKCSAVWVGRGGARNGWVCLVICVCYSYQLDVGPRVGSCLGFIWVIVILYRVGG